MSKYGNKFTCWSCGTKFYDLGRAESKCPKCAADPHQAPAAEKGGASGGGKYAADEDGDFGELEDIETDEVADENE